MMIMRVVGTWRRYHGHLLLLAFQELIGHSRSGMQYLLCKAPLLVRMVRGMMPWRFMYVAACHDVDMDRHDAGGTLW